jgi:hypothetical protein
VNNCNDTKSKPKEVRKCDYNPCNNGKKDVGEEGIDCGGKCSPCKKFTGEPEKNENSTHITGSAIKVKPYSMKEPLYLLPTILLLLAVVATFSLKKAKLSKWMKTALSAMHVILIIGLVSMAVYTFVDVPNTLKNSQNLIQGYFSLETGSPISPLLGIILLTALTIGAVSIIIYKRRLKTKKK